MKKKLQVFVSSTFTDLIQERQAAVQAILKAGHIPAGMELFKASDKSQWETITRWIDESDAYILILGGRYGSIDPSTKISYTEMEYDYAIAKGKPLFAIVMKDDAIELKAKEHGLSFIERENPQLLTLFRQKVLQTMSSFFHDERDIKLAVHENLGDLRDDPTLTGWVSGSEIPDTQSLNEQIANLRKENERLKRELTSAAKNKSPAGSPSIDEIIRLLELTAIKIPANVIGSESDVDANLLLIFKAWANNFVTGITTTSSSETQKFLFSRACPQLAIYKLMLIEQPKGKLNKTATITELGKSVLAEVSKRDLLAPLDTQVQSGEV